MTFYRQDSPSLLIAFLVTCLGTGLAFMSMDGFTFYKSLGIGLLFFLSGVAIIYIGIAEKIADKFGINKIAKYIFFFIFSFVVTYWLIQVTRYFEFG